MIRWKLNELMAARRISGKQLADSIQQHPNSISRMRRSPSMPSIDGELLDKLCRALKCVPSDLIDFTLPEEESQNISSTSIKFDSLDKYIAVKINSDIVTKVKNHLDDKTETTLTEILEIVNLITTSVIESIPDKVIALK